MRSWTAAFFIIVLLGSTSASADYSLAEYRKIRQTGGKQEIMLQVYIQGILTGLLHSNAYLEINNKEKTYCQPEKMSITVGQAMNIMERYLDNPKSKRILKNIPEKHKTVGILVFYSLVDVFPCA